MRPGASNDADKDDAGRYAFNTANSWRTGAVSVGDVTSDVAAGLLFASIAVSIGSGEGKGEGEGVDAGASPFASDSLVASCTSCVVSASASLECSGLEEASWESASDNALESTGA